MSVINPSKEADAVLGSFKVNLAGFPVNGVLNYIAADPEQEFPGVIMFTFTPTDEFKKAAADVFGIDAENVTVGYSFNENSCYIEAAPAESTGG